MPGLALKNSVKLNLVVAVAENGGIGKNNALPWKLAKDMAFFKRITSTAKQDMKNAVIMGRKTWESIPERFRPLANRFNIVLSSSMPTEQTCGVRVARSFPDALQLLDTDAEMREVLDRVFVIGGFSLFKETLDSPNCHRIYYTKIHKSFDSDVFFPQVNWDCFSKISDSVEVAEDVVVEGDISYEFQAFEKVGTVEVDN